MDKKQTISITGGTGHLGHCLLVKLLEQGHHIKALYNRQLPFLKHSNLTWIKGNITQGHSFNEFLKGSDTLIHSAGLISIGDQNSKLVFQVNVVGTENLIKACISYQVKMVYVSSCTAVQETLKNELFKEDRPYKTKNDFTYGYTKALAEQKVLAAVKDGKLAACIVRPSSIIGPPDYRPSPFGKTILDYADNKMPIITNGGYNLVDVRDVSQTIINSLQKKLTGEIYLLSGTYLTIKEIAKIANPTKFFFKISIDLLLVLLPIIKLYDYLVGIPWPLTKESLITLKLAPLHMDHAKATRELNHQSRPPSESILDLLSWYKEQQQ